MAHTAVFQSSSSLDISRTSAKASDISASQLRSREIQLSQLSFLGGSVKGSQAVRLKVSSDCPDLTQQTIDAKPKVVEPDNFKELRQGFFDFKQRKYLMNLEYYKRLSEAQAPKFMVIACADSRVCPSTILGFQPGDAFVVRNVANLVPPYENGPTETNAALEFAVNSLEVENILIIGHSRCGGIKALMSMEDDRISSSFIKNWVVGGNPARLKIKANYSDLPLDSQCRHCEMESIYSSMLNLLTYPWIEERVMREKLSIHCGYYDFIDCTFEKKTLDYFRSNIANGECVTKNREFWS